MLSPRTGPRADLIAVAIGLVAGVFSGLLGVGGGLVMVPAIVLVLGFGQHEAHATSLAAIVPIAVAGVLVFGAADRLDLLGGAFLAAGAILGARAGALWMRRIPEPLLRALFGVFALAVAVTLALR